MNEFMLYMLIVFLPLYVAGLFIDRFSRREIVFGVTFTIKLLDDKFIKSVRKKYLLLYNILVIVFFIVISFLVFTYKKEGFIMLAVLAWIIIISVLVASANRQLLMYKKSLLEKSTEKVVNKRSNNRVVMVNTERRRVYNKSLFIIPILISLITIIVTILRYNSIPDKIPMNFDLLGNVTNYADKNIFTVFTTVFVQIFVIGLIYFVNAIINKAKFTLNPKKPQVSELQMKLARHRMSLLMIGLVSDLCLLFLYFQFKIVGIINFDYIIDIIVISFSILIIFVGLTIYYVTTGDYGDKIKIESDVDDDELVDNDDELWLFGMFYNNPNDSSINVPKRLGGGYTINIGHPVGKAIFICLLLIIFALLVLSIFLI